MQLFFLFSALITLAAVFSYINTRIFKLPPGISLMLMGTIASIILLVAGDLSDTFTNYIKHELSLINFSEILLGVFLSFLLFAGSLHVDYSKLRSFAKSILSFAIVGTILSTFLIGTILFFLLPLFELSVPYIYCLLFGALISPTDPIAVMGILKTTNLPESIEIKITGESLFNDGIGVVIFATILEISNAGAININFSTILILFLREAAGGIVMGLIIGYTGFKMMKSINDSKTEVLISLAMVMGGYSLCHFIHVSGPLAMVVAGIITGNKGRKEAMSDTTKDYLEKFWSVTDDILNALLFMLIGLELVMVGFRVNYFTIGIIIAILLILARYISLLLPALAFNLRKSHEKRTLEIMTWGGLRGGISIALALSLDDNIYKNMLVAITFTVVLFSIMVQGLTIKKFMKLVLINKQ